MKHSARALATTLIALAVAAPAAAEIIGFNGPYAPATWTTFSTGTLSGGSANAGSVTMTPTSLSITGGNSTAGCVGGQYGFLGPCQINVVTSHIENPFSFDWAYATSDSDGPAGDIFGFIQDGVRVQLSDPGGPINQAGHRIVTASSSFGWFVNCSDCTGGTATARVTNFQAGLPSVRGVPEPSSLALAALALSALASAARRRIRIGRAGGRKILEYHSATAAIDAA